MCNYDHVKEYRKRKPWARPREWARRRCVDKKHREYNGYGGRGITFSLTMEEAERLYVRDKAHRLDKPSLDRVDPDGPYSFENCRFIELRDNITDHRPAGTLSSEEPKNAEETIWTE